MTEIDTEIEIVSVMQIKVYNDKIKLLRSAFAVIYQDINSAGFKKDILTKEQKTAFNEFVEQLSHESDT